MSKKEQVSLLFSAADRCKDLMFAAERHIWKNPETGFREWNTTKYLAG